MKRKALLSSILTIVLCVSIIAGSTFALFTSQTELNIAVTSGEVDVLANFEDLTLYSVVPDEVNGTEVDEFGALYRYEQQSEKFLNSGTATINGSVLTLERITPGDKVSFKVNVDNGSNVAIAHRLSLSCLNGYGLMYGLKVTIGGTTYESLESYVGGWSSLAANGAINDVEVVIELPVSAGNEYQKLSTSINILVEAVQSNASVEIGGAADVDYIETVNTPDALATAIAAGGNIVLGADVNVGAAPIEIPAGVEVSLDLLGHTITSELVSEGRHAYAINNYGSLTLTGNGDIKARGIQNFGEMIVNGDLTITNLDGNGGAAIWNEGDLYIVNGNFVSSENGGDYGVAVNTRAGGTATILGGNFTTYSDLSYALISEGEMTVHDATVYGRHGAVYGGEIYGGTYVQENGLIGTTDWCAFDAILYGGTYSSDASDAGGGLFYTNVTVADGYVAVVNADGTTSIVAE